MEERGLSLWIYVGVLALMLMGALQRLLPLHLSSRPALVARLWASVLTEWLGPFWTAALLIVSLTLGLAWWLRPARVSGVARLAPEGRAVCITGCDSGFGKASAKRLDALGFKVFATVMDQSGEGAMELRSACSSRLSLLQVDITRPEQVQQMLLAIKTELGLKGLWGLVNNAGVCVNFGDAELSLMSTYRRCMEVNFFGSLSVTKTLLPLLRRSRGRIVTVSSPAGDQPFPCLAAYGASKAALNLLTNTLRHELEPWGVQVSTILPSSYRTGQSGNELYWGRQQDHLLLNLGPALLEEYGQDYLAETRELFQEHARNAAEDLSPVVNAIVQALLSPQPRVRYYAGPGVGFMYFLSSYLPYSVSDTFLQKLFVKKKLMPQALRRHSGLGLQAGVNNNNNNNNNNNEEEKSEQ
ncbi:11-beta-hydroxysteroid dehydrogenase type 2 [Gadus macrocephalus]|uniref:11-beta-hydroxysteroid dehydrogenase type 2 n=1 Tax=Gadus macrocephalus TaxID=80720 RepID=UPI0028CB4350|nr:11-beta-hydroxysteroid dehydrogenase type 2 [Gadus macrocephalus]